MRMVDVGEKAKTDRAATARGRVSMRPATARAIRAGEIAKGNVLEAARLAAILGTKLTPQLVPLCHPISLAGVEALVSVRGSGVDIEVTVKTVDRTGVEMEALTAVCAAALTVYDMCKSIDPAMTMETVQLVAKHGGKRGVWKR